MSNTIPPSAGLQRPVPSRTWFFNTRFAGSGLTTICGRERWPNGFTVKRELWKFTISASGSTL